ncbi:CBO0543 family protein [Bacillus sp. CGMCC 1.16607]|uniref:CBO0543 family protein n=1 Tax=Bacillus sp. CGMCC 1.16607 TaxID=3351842 RepID=UPI00362949A7
MFHILIGFFTIICAWCWGDWKNWKKYLSTIQFFIIGDLLYNMFTLNYQLWSYPNPPNLLPNHVFNNLFIMFTIYPSTLLVYLYRFPKDNFLKQCLYMFFWIALWLLFEFIMVWKGLCVYTNGWTFGWSIFFVIIMLPMLLLHFYRPLLAYVLSVPIIVFLLLRFQVPIN